MNTVHEPRRNKVFALEGLDGTGKTTAGKLLAEQTGNQYVYCMDGNRLRRFRERFDTAPTPVRFLYYVAVPLDNYRRIERRRKVSDVYVDRTVAASIAYHKAYGLQEGWIKLVPPFLMRQIDAMLYFTIGEDERVRRMKERQITPGMTTASDDRSLLLSRKIDSAYRNVFSDRTLEIRTDNKNPQQVVDELKRRIYEK